MFDILYHSDVVGVDFPLINRNILRRIRSAIENRLQRAPCDYGKPLRGTLRPLWRIRVGDYRILYHVSACRVLILQVVHRKDAYREGIAEARRRGLL